MKSFSVHTVIDGVSDSIKIVADDVLGVIPKLSINSGVALGVIEKIIVSPAKIEREYGYEYLHVSMDKRPRIGFSQEIKVVVKLTSQVLPNKGEVISKSYSFTISGKDGEYVTDAPVDLKEID
jgi:hypothetical protein